MRTSSKYGSIAVVLVVLLNVALTLAMPCNVEDTNHEVAGVANVSTSAHHYAERVLAEVDSALNSSKYPECADALCLVQAILNRRPFIYITANIDLQGVGILPTIDYEATIIGLCDHQKSCQLDAKHQSGIFVVGLGGYLSLKDLDLTQGFCSEGPAVLVSGLGAHSPTTGGKLEARNVKFFNNIAIDVGGAISVQGGASVYVSNSVFYNNKASKKGGAVYLGGSSKTLNHHVNATTPGAVQPLAHSCSYRTCATFANTEFNRNIAQDVGGAIYVDDATADCAAVGGAQLDLSTCTFLNNTAVKNSGGAIFLAFHSAGAVASVKHSAFLNNSAAIHGGDVDLDEGSSRHVGPVLDAYDTVFAYGKAQHGQSICAHVGSKASFTKCDFSSFVKSPLECLDNNCNNTCPFNPDQHDICANVVEPKQLCPWTPQDCPTTHDSSSSSTPPPTYDDGNHHTPPSTPINTPESDPIPTPDDQSSPIPPSSPSHVHHDHNKEPSTSHGSSDDSNHDTPTNDSTKKKNKTKVPSPNGFGTISNAPPSPPSKSNKIPPPPSSGGSVTGDPHFLGKHGERFDFQGKDGKNYCVVSDKNLHINMHIFHGHMRKATFISKLGILYKGHTILIDAQAPSSIVGNEEGFVNHIHHDVPHSAEWWRISVDNNNLVGIEDTHHATSLNFEGSGLTITKAAQYAHIYAPDEVDILVQIIPATFGKRGSLKNYINLQVSNLKASPQVHGLLGQTFKDDAHAIDKMHRAKHIKRSRASQIVVDGSDADYVTTDILAPDCKFSTFDIKQQKNLEVDTTNLHDGQKTRRALIQQETYELDMNHQQLLIASSCVGFGDQSLCGGQ